MIRQLLLVSLFISAFAQWDLVTENERSKRSQIYCGEELNKALFLICGGLYNSPFKKSALQSYDDYYSDYGLLDSLEESKGDFRFPFHPKARALSALQYKRLKRGVHDECCRKSCSINEIKGYCLKRN
ncbi:LIRP isoform X2 [Halyomorpha halys]|nr:LIRP isoform X2 [Halyomorpha halys]XP_014280186.1 LIRP isoform X2 [Halyomorpha halys]XP_014280187.1 LIRP isoform X2 [Halyomorpha halys]XP_014280188.1 LIRP isoform X2 [Halyomorpha halys]XP_014280189.1 LIRP isoform X2 [Halyomorpha halys]